MTGRRGSERAPGNGDVALGVVAGCCYVGVGMTSCTQKRGFGCRRFALPKSGESRLVVYGDNDGNFTSQKVANVRACGLARERW